MIRLTLILLFTAPVLAQAWSECGHHVVALIAYDLLNEQQQTDLVELLEKHPRYVEDFTPAEKVNDKLRYRIGRSGYWPDVARGTSNDRPSWHYQLAATLIIGDESAVDVPADPGPLPFRASMTTRKLHVAQAIELCRKVMADQKAPVEDRAIALCWLAHLVGDSHQPCHAGSLYAAGVFPDGDRGGNEIKLVKGRNLHSLWDGLLGGRFDENRVRREVYEITSDQDYLNKGTEADGELEPLEWLKQSRRYAERFTYTQEVLAPIQATVAGRAESLPKVQLSPEYLSRAGIIARIRVIQAGHRLAGVWAECLEAEELEQDASIVEDVERVKVWVTKSGKKYHREDCRYCDKSGVAIDLTAVRGRVEPCKVCNPPR